MGKLRQMSSMIKPNWKTFASFEIFFRLLTGALFPPLFRSFFSLVLRSVGVRYVTAENFRIISSKPLVWAGLLLLLFLYACIELAELSGLIYIIDQSRRTREVTFRRTMKISFNCLKNVFSRRNICILFVILILSPVFHLATAINLLWSFSVFGKLFRLIRRDTVLSVVLLLLILLTGYLFIRWRYAVHYYVLEQKSAAESVHASSRLSRVRKPWQVLSVALLQAVILLGYLMVVLLVLLLSAALQGIFSLPGAGVSTFQVVFLHAAVLLCDVMVVPLMLLFLSVTFYENKRKRGEKVYRSLKVRERYLSEKGPDIRTVERAILVLAATAGLIYLVSVSGSQFSLRIERLNTMQVTAHRGASMHYPENTMAAFRGAVEEGADWIELDVQESADGQIIVMHDDSFKRTTGQEYHTWEVSYDEICQMDAGSFFSSDFEGEKIPLLSEVLEFAKAVGVRLNIEIKPSGHEKNLIPSVVALVEEAGCEDNCVITSQRYYVIQKVKQLNEEIRTVYVTGLAYGAINRLKDADAFSIRSTSITRTLVRRLHNRGFQVYAWTVDSRKNINRMINMGVDNIITNNVALAIECINDSRTSNLITEMLKSARDLF